MRRPARHGGAGCSAQRRPDGAGRRGLAVERDDHLVGTDQAELAADQLLGEIGIGVARIEQLRAMGEPRPLGLELGELDAALGLGAAIIAPGEHAIVADHGGSRGNRR